MGIPAAPPCPAGDTTTNSPISDEKTRKALKRAGITIGSCVVFGPMACIGLGLIIALIATVVLAVIWLWAVATSVPGENPALTSPWAVLALLVPTLGTLYVGLLIALLSIKINLVIGCIIGLCDYLHIFKALCSRLRVPLKFGSFFLAACIGYFIAYFLVPNRLPFTHGGLLLFAISAGFGNHIAQYLLLPEIESAVPEEAING